MLTCAHIYFPPHRDSPVPSAASTHPNRRLNLSTQRAHQCRRFSWSQLSISFAVAMQRPLMWCPLQTRAAEARVHTCPEHNLCNSHAAATDMEPSAEVQVLPHRGCMRTIPQPEYPACATAPPPRCRPSAWHMTHAHGLYPPLGVPFRRTAWCQA